MSLNIIYKNGKLTIAKHGQAPFVTCKPYDRAHAKAIAERFKAWNAQGWPYIPKD